MKYFYIVLSLSIVFSGSVLSGNGIIGGLGGGDDKPKRDDNPPVKPATGTPPGKPAVPATGGGKKAEKSPLEIGLEGRRKYLEKAIKDAEAGKKSRKFDQVSEAERSIARMEKKLKTMERQLDLADREGAAELRNTIDAFGKKWADVATAIHEKRVPDGMSGEQWARVQDEYFKAKAQLEAKRADLAYDLKRKREGDLKGLRQMVDKAKKTLQKMKDERKDGDSAMSRVYQALLEKQAHEADIALMKKQLAEYKQLQAEIRGEKSTRTDNLMQDVYMTSSLWYVNELGKVIREMSIQFATKPLTKKQQGLDVTPAEGADSGAGAASGVKDDDEGLPLPEWMKQKPKKKDDDKKKPEGEEKSEEEKTTGFKKNDWKKAKHKALSAQLEYAHQQLLAMDNTVKTEDETELRNLRNSLEWGDQSYGDHVFEKYRAQREAKIEKRRKELAVSRKARTAERKKRMQSHIDHLKKNIALTAKQRS